MGVVALVPVFVTFDVPFTVVPVRIPAYLREVAPGLPAGTVLLTVPFAVSGSTQPMLWQADDDMHFRLAGAALKTPNAVGRSGRAGRAGLGPADPDRPDHHGGRAAHRDAGPGGDRPARTPGSGRWGRW